jgi:type I restriction-modification system DNA methylase subunit
VDAYDEELVEDGLKKANELGCWFFATWNVNKLVLWETFRPETRLIDRRLKHWDVADVKRIEDVKKADVERRIKHALQDFLETLKQYYVTKESKPAVPVIPKLYPDEIMVLRLRSAVDTLYLPLSDRVIDFKEKDPVFFKSVGEWFIRQGWIFTGVDDDFDRLSRQTVYLLINKILFYNVLRDRFKLASIDLAGVSTEIELKKRLQEYFNTGVKLGYGLIFASDFLEEIPIPDAAVPELRKLVMELNKYDFSQIGYDIVGKIFERLIPSTERHKLGQYFTRAEVVDLIVGMTVKNSDVMVLDPACGSGTFLVRSYYRKKYLAEKSGKPEKDHVKLLNELWGIDISKFPATLTDINLMIRKLEADNNKPNVLCKDFFDASPGVLSSLFEPSREYTPSVKKEEYEIEIPKEFGVVITNPPYTRQEEMEDLLQKGYKDRLRTLIQKTLDIKLAKRASIYAYFFLWGAHFLKTGGRLGLITSNSWLDVDFGKHLQEFFLKNFKIIAIIESKFERWFEDADINTAITILEKCDDEAQRKQNWVKFVQLKKNLEYFIPATEDEQLRQQKLENFVDLIENCNEKLAFKEIKSAEMIIKVFEDSNMRIVMVNQNELFREGYDEEERKFVGAKWGKYLRAPDIFFKVLEKGKDIFVPLKHVANIRFGLKTGANEFFYLLEEDINRLGIEKEFWMHKEGNVWIPNYVIKTPKEIEGLVVKPEHARFRVLLIRGDKDKLHGLNVLRYISWGEQQGFHRRPTCASRKRWYELPDLPPADILFRQFFDVKFNFPYKADQTPVDHTFYYLCLKNKEMAKAYAAIINSTLYSLIVEIYARTVMGQGVLIAYGPEMRPVPMIDLSKVPSKLVEELKNAFDEIATRPIGTIFDEIGARTPEKVSFKKVKTDRRKLDKIVMEKILHLSPEEELEIYKGIIDLVNARIKRARSAERRKKRKGVDVNALAEHVLKQIDITSLRGFPDKYMEKVQLFNEVEIPEGRAEIASDLVAGFYVGIGRSKIPCSSKAEAQFLWLAAMAGKRKVKVPLDKKTLEDIVNNYMEKFASVQAHIRNILNSIVPDEKLKAETQRLVLAKLFKD